MDPGEKANRIWEWWRSRLLGSKEFPAFKPATQLVVLPHISSCYIERVSLHLKIIRDTCQENLYADMIEIRIFMHCNGDMDELIKTFE